MDGSSSKLVCCVIKEGQGLITKNHFSHPYYALKRISWGSRVNVENIFPQLILGEEDTTVSFTTTTLDFRQTNSVIQNIIQYICCQ